MQLHHRAAWIRRAGWLVAVIGACVGEANDAPDLSAQTGSGVDFGSALDTVDRPASCVGEAHQSERLPADLYFLIDTSGSMAEQTANGEKWELVSRALINFLERQDLADLGVGVGYFPSGASAACMPGAPGCICIPFVNLCLPNVGGSCNPDDYATPSVPLSLPSDPAQLVADIGVRELAGGTPTRPALQGAVEVVSAWARQHPDRRTAVVLATDGDPTGCPDNEAEAAAAVAAAALSGPNRIRTFVLGVGQSLTRLNAIAQAGGTSQALLTDTAGDLVEQLGEALERIRSGTTCDFVIPREGAGGVVDPQRVNVLLTAEGAAEPQIVARTAGGSADDCDAGGWYYDDPDAPRSIRLCDVTCRQSGGALVEVEYGCTTLVNPR